MRIVVLTPEAFGGHGGIAQYNRDVLQALCEQSYVTRVIALPRLVRTETGVLPDRLDYRHRAAGGAAAYLRELIRVLLGRDACDLVICAHINLLPLAEMLRRRFRAPVWLLIYGIDAWRPTGRPLSDRLAKTVDSVVSISHFTADKFSTWSGFPDRVNVLPNAIRTEAYGVGGKPQALLERYALAGRKVLMTLGRLSAAERYKGIDEMLELLPDLAADDPSLCYLVVGDGDDRSRLEAKAATLGLEPNVIFTGRIGDDEKADHYRLADVFVMAGRGEGFGFVFLEAMACGIPVVASEIDGSREAVRNGAIGLLANPDDDEGLKRAVYEALAQPRGVPDGLDYFSYPRFCERLAGLLGDPPSAREAQAA